jgi:hypothetical protein
LALLIACLLLVLSSRIRMSPHPQIAKVEAAPPWTSRARSLSPTRWGWIAITIIGVTAIALRVAIDPLSGYDHTFRWDFLARQMWGEESLRFYPPVTADDFLRYGWCDGIAPLISTLHFWAYCSAGKTAGWATTPIVLVQAALIFRNIHQLASVRAAAIHGLLACGFAATSALLLWAIAMGQETGMTTLGLIAMFRFLEMDRSRPTEGWIVCAGMAAGASALAREYGVVFVGFGVIALLDHSRERRGWIEFLVAAAVVALPWYLRNWLHTGNPFYSHPIGNIFPYNERGAEYLRIVSEFYGLTYHPENIPTLARLLMILAGIPIVGGALAAFARRGEFRPWSIAFCGTIALWLWSIGQTSGGLNYSLRVLAPAVALGAVLIARTIPPRVVERYGKILAALTLAVSIDAAARSLYLPALPKVSWWRQPITLWRDISQHAAQTRAQQSIWANLATAAADDKIVISDPVFHALLIQLHAKPIPFFSPAIAFIFSPNAELITSINQLRREGVRFIVLIRNNPFIDGQLARHVFFEQLRRCTATVETDDLQIYDLHAASFPTVVRQGR